MNGWCWLLDWFAGGTHRYMTLYHCMNGDWPWILITVALDGMIATGYVVIAVHWWHQQQREVPSLAHRALGNMTKIFVFCGICGYVFIPIKMFWPAWRLYDIFLAILAYYTWRYAWNVHELRVVYDELSCTLELRKNVHELQEESRRKTFFLTSVSHDLRTPLNGIMLQAQLAEMLIEDLGNRDGSVAELATVLAEIQRGAKATGEMLDGFLELGRLDWGRDPTRPSTFLANDLFDKVGQLINVLAIRKSLSLNVEVPANLWITTDLAKLERVLVNLATNAVKYSEAGSVSLTVEASRSDLAIHVVDTGIGIAEENLPRLFDEFYQVNNHERDRAKGYGLGLSIAGRLAKQLGGRIHVTSALGSGSHFVVVLPGVVASGQR